MDSIKTTGRITVDIPWATSPTWLFESHFGVEPTFFQTWSAKNEPNVAEQETIDGTTR